MCQKVACSKCGKATWKGCGQHIDSALAGTSEADRCMGWRTGIRIATPKAADDKSCGGEDEKGEKA